MDSTAIKEAIEQEKICIVRIKNSFQAADREMELIDYSGESLLEIRNRHFPADVDVVVCLNGEVLSDDDIALCIPIKNDVITFTAKMGDDVLRIIVGVILVVLAVIIYALGWWTGIGAVIGTALLYVGIGLIVGGVIGLLFPAKRPILPGTGQDYDSSQTYGWNPATIQQQGLAIPRAYGLNKLYGNIIAANLENINNKQYINSLICLGMGPVQRLYNFKINDQPYENLTGIEIHARYGNLNQDIIPNFNDTKIEYPASVKVVNGSPYIYTTTNDNFDGLEVDVTFPSGLWYANDSGGLNAISVSLRIEISLAGQNNWQAITYQMIGVPTTVPDAARWSSGYWDGDNWVSRLLESYNPDAHYEGELDRGVGYWRGHKCYWHWLTSTTKIITVDQQVDYVTITAAQASVIRRTYKTEGFTRGKYDIRITNLSADQTSSRYGDDMYLSSVREVYNDDFEHPRHVLVGLKALATDQLSGSLRFSCMAECLLVRVYNGTSWAVQYSNNPAWAAYDVLTLPVFDNILNVFRYDGYDPSVLDYTKFKEWADFCDTLVPDGKGGTEKRITFNGVFDSGTSAWDALMQVCRIGRAAPILTGNKITLFIDKPAPVSQLFSIGNTIINSFKETFLPESGRAGEVEIDYINSEKDYERDTATIINPAIDTDRQATHVQLFGITKPSEAWRTGQYLLSYNQYLQRIIEFSAAADAIACTIGDVIYFQCDVAKWGLGGRIVSATSNTVVLDREVTIEAGKSYIVLVRLSDDTRVQMTVTNSPGNYTTLTLSGSFATIPSQYDIYSFGESTKVTKPFRITDIQYSQDLEFKLKAIEYNETIYNIDNGQPALPTPNYSGLSAYPPVTDILLDELLIKAQDGSINDVIDVYFRRPTDYNYLYAEIWHNNGGGWIYSGAAIDTVYRINNVEINKTYQIAIVTINTAGGRQPIQSAPQKSIYTLGKLDLPSSVTNFTTKQDGQFINFNWTHIPDADLWGYEIRQGTVWEGARIISGEGVQQNSLDWRAELNGTYRFLIKAIDASGLYSSAAVSVDITLRNINENLNIILSQDEMTKASPADGVKTNFVYISAYHALMLPHTLLDTDAPGQTDQWADITNYTGNINLNAEYITNAIDTLKDGDTWLRIIETIDANETGATDQSYPSRTDLSYSEDTDQHITMPVDYKIYYQVSDDNITYSSWAEYVGTVQQNFRYAKIKFVLNLASQTGRFKLLNFLLSFDVPDVEYIIQNFVVTAGTGNDILFSTYSLQFYNSFTVQASLLGSTVNKVPVITKNGLTGYHIDLLDTTNAKVTGTVDMQIKGY